MSYCDQFKQFLYKLKVLWNSITYVPDYTIKGAYLQYSADAAFDLDGKSPLWIDEAKYWDSVDAWYDWDLGNIYATRGIEGLRDVLRTIPDEVNGRVLFIKYTYGTRTYKFATSDPEFLWTPEKIWADDALTFRFPLEQVWAVDGNDRKVVDITKKITSVAGPRGDFHHQDVPFKHIMKYNYPKIFVKTLLNSETYGDEESVLVL